MQTRVDKAWVSIPEWVRDLRSFRRWATSDQFPEEGRVSYLDGNFLVDMSMETLEHNAAKKRIMVRLDPLAVEEDLGTLVIDGMRLTHPEVELNVEPDAFFIAKKSLQRQRLRFMRNGKSLEAVGSPDMALEVVSPSSEEKDTVTLPDLYFRAGVQEYWLVDPRGELRFTLYRRSATKFVATPRRGGWLRSDVFEHSFRLTRTTNDLNLPEYTLEVK